MAGSARIQRIGDTYAKATPSVSGFTEGSKSKAGVQGIDGKGLIHKEESMVERGSGRGRGVTVGMIGMAEIGGRGGSIVSESEGKIPGTVNKPVPTPSPSSNSKISKRLLVKLKEIVAFG